jgi:hypothetical protein
VFFGSSAYPNGVHSSFGVAEDSSQGKRGDRAIDRLGCGCAPFLVVAFIVTTETTLASLDPALGFAVGGFLFALVLVGLVGFVVAYVILGFPRGR